MKILFDDFIVFIDLPTSYRSSGNVSLSIKILGMLQPHFGLSVRVKPTLPKVGTWSPSGLPKTQSPSWRAKTPCIGVFLVSLEKVLKCRCLNWPRIDHLDICSPSYGQKKGRESNWQFDSRPLKVGNRPLPDICSGSATWRWKALEESYNFGSNLVLIRDRGEKLWTPKVPRVQTGTVSRLHLGSPGKKSHLDVASAWSCKEYSKGEGGGFPRVRAVVCHVSPS